MSQTTVSLSEPSVNQALELRPIQLFWITWQSTYHSLNWMGFFDSLNQTAGNLVILKPCNIWRRRRWIYAGNWHTDTWLVSELTIGNAWLVHSVIFTWTLNKGKQIWFGFKQPLVGEKRCVTTQITAAEYTKPSPAYSPTQKYLDLSRVSLTSPAEPSSIFVVTTPPNTLQWLVSFVFIHFLEEKA